jgi:hypothetical protein
VNDGIREIWNPDQGGIDNCVAFGKAFAAVVR